MFQKCITHNSMFPLSYLSALNISTLITKIFLKEYTKSSTTFSVLHFYSSKLLQLTYEYIQVYQSAIRLISLGPTNNIHNVA